MNKKSKVVSHKHKKKIKKAKEKIKALKSKAQSGKKVSANTTPEPEQKDKSIQETK